MTSETKILRLPEPDTGPRAATRRRQLLSVAADLFAKQGFDATSMRDIATASGMMSGSLYYHFSSKEELFISILELGSLTVIEKVEEAIKDLHDPWERLEAATIAHCKVLLEPSDIKILFEPLVTITRLAPVYKERVLAWRKVYHLLFRRLIDALDLPLQIDRRLFLLNFLGAIAWSGIWYANGDAQDATPTDVAKQIIAMVRQK